MAGYATCEGTTALSDALKTIAIIMVPGIMGTRLNRTINGVPSEAWNPPTTGFMGAPGPPLGGWTGWATGSDELLIDYTCYPDEGWTAKVADLDDGYGQDAHKIGEFNSEDGEVLPSGSHGTLFSVLPCYYPLVFAMADLEPNDEYLKAAGFAPRVYCAGYDFRKDNRLAAELLEGIVNRALDECDHDKVILVAHSMGGLVSRYYARKHPENVQAVVLIGSPSIGAPEAYLYLKDFHDAKLAAALGHTKSGAQHFTRYNMPAIYQLAAADMYAFAKWDYDWIDFSDEVAEQRQNPHIPSSREVRAPTDCSDVDLLYANGHTGFIDYGDGHMQTQRDYLDSALNFHRLDLASHETTGTTQPSADEIDQTLPRVWMHPRTYVAYSAQHDTIVAIKITDDGETERVMGSGDGSVPLCSGKVEDTIVGPYVDGRSPVLERHSVAGPQVHGALCEAPDVITWTKLKILDECKIIGAPGYPEVPADYTDRAPHYTDQTGAAEPGEGG